MSSLIPGSVSRPKTVIRSQSKISSAPFDVACSDFVRCLRFAMSLIANQAKLSVTVRRRSPDLADRVDRRCCLSLHVRRPSVDGWAGSETRAQQEPCPSKAFGQRQCSFDPFRVSRAAGDEGFEFLLRRFASCGLPFSRDQIVF